MSFAVGLILFVILAIVILFSESSKKQKQEQQRDLASQNYHRISSRWQSIHCSEGNSAEKNAALERKNKMFFSLRGNEKTVQMCSFEAEYYRAAAEYYKWQQADLMHSAATTYRSMAGRERNAGVWGGLANGAAGIGAGIAAAVDVENQNAATRAHNQQLMSSIAGLALMSHENLAAKEKSYRADAGTWKYRADSAVGRHVEYPDSQTLMDALAPEVKELTLTESGAVKLVIHVQKAEMEMVSGGLGIVDGSFTATLWSGEEAAGTVHFTFPWDGCRYSKLIGICCQPDIQARDYRVTFAPHCLWLVEDSFLTKHRAEQQRKEQEKKEKEREENEKVQAEIDVIRQQQQALTRYAAYSGREKRIAMLEAQYNDSPELDSLLEQARTKYVAEMTSDMVMYCLEITQSAVTKSTHGSFIVTATVRMHPNYAGMTLGQSKAVVDGVLCAQVYDGERKIGEALLVLPIFGICEPAEITGIGFGEYNPRSYLTAKINPHSLWLMEA